MKQPEIPFQRPFQKLNRRLFNTFNRLARITLTALPSGAGRPKYALPRSQASPIHRCHLAEHPTVPGGRRPPVTPNNCRESWTGSEQLLGKVPFQEVAFPVPPLISAKKISFRDQIPGWDLSCASSPRPANRCLSLLSCFPCGNISG